MKQLQKFFKMLLPIIMILLTGNLVLSSNLPPQEDPVLSPEITVHPVIDGIADDICWQNVPWQNIDQVWIPYEGNITEDDYTGRYKVVWSSETNLLYFLVEITDDVFIDGYVPSRYGGSYNYDITEVFIDENDSGGEHRYDGAITNAENAFAYHMYAEYPEDGEVNTTPYIEDMVGTQQTSKWIDHSFHFPEFALRKEGNIAIREFSLIVYDDTYTEENKDSAIVKLEAGKVMGLSVAYCDNDNSDGNRDNMYGSVWEPSPGNLHWMNADTFGNIKLVSELSTGVPDRQSINESFILFDNYPNPFNPSTNISFYISEAGNYTLKVYNTLGENIATLLDRQLIPGNYSVTFDTPQGLNDYSASGIYFYELEGMSRRTTKKMILLK